MRPTKILRIIEANEDIEDYGLSLDLLRKIEQEEKQVLLHKKLLEMINLGNGDEIKEVKIGTSLSSSIKGELIDLLREYVDVFAWSYQDMPRLEPDIVVHKLPLRPDYKSFSAKVEKNEARHAFKDKRGGEETIVTT